MNEEREPQWKVFLNWSAVITWFLMPLCIFSLQLVWSHFSEHLKDFAWLSHYYGDLTLLVFGLAGMHLVDKKVPSLGRNNLREEKARE